MKKTAAAVLALTLGAAASAASADSTSFIFNYMATNLKGDFATASGGSAVPVARLDLEDLANDAGVRATFQLLPNGLSQFADADAVGGLVYISSFELNFPGTVADGTYTFANVSGVPLSGGIEWEENGATNGWGAAQGDPSFEQELNWGNSGIMNQSTGTTVVDLFNAPGTTNISVASLLANPVHNSNDPSLPDAYAWIKIRSLNQGIDKTDGSNWWGTPINNANGGRLDVLAVAAVPEPSEYAMMGLGLGILGFVARRRAKAA
ncbi:MAG: PEP-CTERM sorting domain-containing protein [Betaproteobacteria bacterium]|nr:PEP-CTERM sorting domain-containing protein [Betaproteobacteria bacterium]